MPATTKKRKASDEAQALTPVDIMGELNKRWPGAVILGNDPSLKITRLPTGILGLDIALKGGFTRGRHIELYGAENIGKTTIAYSTVASAQRLGGTGVMCDLEGTYDPDYAASLGVNISQFPLHRQKKGHGERAFDFVEAVVRQTNPDVMVIDTIAALLPKAEYESQLDAGTFGTDQARLMSKALRKLTAANERTVYVWLNQTRQVVGASMFAKQTTTSGGRAMGFYAATRIELVRTETLKSINKRAINPSTSEPVKGGKKVAVGHRALARITKDKTGSAKPDAEVPLVYNYQTNRFDELEDLIYHGRVSGVVHKQGNTWWVDGYDDEKQSSRAKFRGWLKRNRAVREELHDSIMEHLVEDDDSEDE